MFRIILFFLLMSLPVLATDSTIGCQIVAQARCICNAPYSVSCENGASGLMSSSSKVTGVTVSVLTSSGMPLEFSFDDIEGAVRDVYPARYSDVIKEKLRSVGVKTPLDWDSLQITQDGLNIVDNTPLYDDHRGESQKGTIKELGGDGSSQSDTACEYLEKPQAIDSSTCSGKICQARALCNLAKLGYQGGIVDTDVICKARVNGSCPTATECAMDPDIYSEEVQDNTVKSEQSAENSIR